MCVCARVRACVCACVCACVRARVCIGSNGNRGLSIDLV